MKKPVYYGFSVDDVALEDWSTPEHLAQLLEFCDELQLKSTFFVVPIVESTDQPFTSLPGYVELLQQAHAAGHCIAQHGLRHNRFELGVPPPMVLNLAHEGPAREFLRQNKERLDREHNVENLRGRLRQGRQILEDALGFQVTGFRAPALQESPAMFEALALEGYAFDSSSCLQETGWDYIQDQMDVAPRRITRERFLAHQHHPAVVELPLTTDYNWYLTEAKYQAVLNLAKHDFLSCVAAGIPFIHVCHVSPIQAGDPGCGFRVLRDLNQFMREEARRQGFELQSCNLAEIAAAIKGSL